MSGAEEHVATPELSSWGDRARSHGTHDSAGAHLNRRRGLKLRNTWQRRSLTQQGGEARGHGPRGSTGAHLSKEVRSGALEHVVAPEPTFAVRCGLKLHLTWQRVDARPVPCLDLELICEGTRSSGCRQRPPVPPRERL
jgi:hypothetical protein